ncbi:MAG: DUF3822 family protein [Phocaeicola sp.]|uniref:DUF3822 family protein n=1 Tax=Phocaeicola TaxID=909656 RepID=UPI00234EDC13|nr:DUF3822 family protein [Phocaeicola oris]MCE2616794.1 DUF3822 family protein [Phocaeicola oris]
MTVIDFTKSDQYSLSIRLSADGFSFSLYNPHDEGSFFYEPYSVNIAYSLTANAKEMLDSSEVFKHTYRHIYILYDTARVTPVPFELFEDDEMEDLFYSNFPKANNETILCNILEKSNIALLFGMDKHAYQLMNERFPHAKYFATVSPLTEYFQKKSKTKNKHLYAYLQKGGIKVFAFDNGRPMLINSFSCETFEDRIYYLLYIWKQLGFDTETDELYLVGNIAEKEKLTDGLEKYIRNVFLIHPRSEFNRSILTQRDDIHFDLQTLLICE